MATQNSSFGPIKSREKVFKHKKALKTQSYSAQIKIVILKFGKYQSKQFQVILWGHLVTLRGNQRKCVVYQC